MLSSLQRVSVKILRMFALQFWMVSLGLVLKWILKSNVFGRVGDITTADSAVKVFVIPTDEELVIARDVERLKTK